MIRPKLKFNNQPLSPWQAYDVILYESLRRQIKQRVLTSHQLAKLSPKGAAK